jgi:site-specific recombinase XerD
MGDKTAARNRTILWIFIDTGMRASELCGLRLSDVNREQRTLRVEGRSHERWLPLSPNGWYQVLSYLELHRPKKSGSERKEVGEEPLFLSETYEPLSINALTLLFHRLRKRAGMSGQHINPSQLRDTFAVRYLRAGGEPDALRALLGLRGKTALTRYEQLSTKKIEHGVQKEPAEEHLPGQQPVPHKSKQRRRRSSSAATRNHQQRDTRKRDGIVEKGSATDAKEDS